MKRNWILGALGIVLLMTALLAIARGDRHPNNNNVEEQPVEEVITSTEPQDELLDNNNDFACNLFRAINRNRKLSDGSIVVSPISVSYLLGMLNEGADGKTRQQITDVLGLSGSTQQINEYFKTMMSKVSRADSNVTLQLANCIDVNSAMGISLLPQYKADMQQYYEAQIDALDFTKRSSLDKINKWCNKHTGGMIPTAVDRLDPDAVMYLLNAIYFKANWTEKFDPEETRDRHFTKRDGTTIKLPMMHLKTKAAYANYDQFKMLRLPYGNKSYSMYVLLPNKGKTIDDIIRNISAQKMKEWQSQMMTEDIDILMPRFTTESETQLGGILSSMGMPRAFGDRAEFPNMLKGHHDDLYVSMMKQKAKIEVSEEGTRAAAVTIAEMSVKCAMPSPPEYVEFHATRPFVYYIMEKSTGAIYFMGIYCFDDTGEPVTIKNPMKEPEPIGEVVARPIPSPRPSSDEIFKTVEQTPQFPGGDAALMEHLDSHIQYPPEAAKQGIQGKVIVQFVVEKTGKVGEVKVVRSVDKDLDKEAVRIIKTLPKFIPGRQNGQAVAVWYALPVTFKLSSVRQK